MGKIINNKTKTKTGKTPWAEAVPYLLGDNEKGIAGVLPTTGDIFNRTGWTDEMQQGSDLFMGQLGQQRSDLSTMRDSIFKAGSGEFDPSFSRVGNIAGVDRVRNIPGVYDVNRILGVDHVTGGKARALQGDVDPTNALKSLLSGSVNTQYLDPLAQSITTQITRNFGENALPQIRGGAIASGQYGGSRQGIAEGLALSRLNQDLSTGISPIYANAFENAQNRMHGTAEALDSRAASMAIQNALNDLNTQQFNAGIDVGNADRRLNTQQFNANLGLQNNEQQLGTQQFNANLGLNNNQQEMAAKDAMMNNRVTSFNALNTNNANMRGLYQDYLSTLTAPQDMDWQNLIRYNSLITPLASEYGTTKGKTTESPSVLSAIMGGAALASMPFTGGMSGIMGGMMGGMGGMGGMGSGMLNYSRATSAPLINGSVGYMNNLMNTNPFRFA